VGRRATVRSTRGGQATVSQGSQLLRLPLPQRSKLALSSQLLARSPQLRESNEEELPTILVLLKFTNATRKKRKNWKNRTISKTWSLRETRKRKTVRTSLVTNL